MAELRNIKISEEVHDALSARADKLGMKIGRLAEALITASLKMSEKQILQEMIDLVEKNEQNTTK